MSSDERSEDGDGLLSPLTQPREQSGWRDTAGLRSVARRRRLRRRALAGAATAIVAVGVVVAVLPSSSTSPDTHVAGATQAVAHVTPLTDFDDSATSAVTEAEQQFAIDLLQNVKTDGANSVLSPVSLAIALAMLQSGAKGATADSIAHVLHTSNLSTMQQDAGWAALVADLADAKNVTLESANSLWAQRNLTLQPNYLNTLARYFRSGVWRTDFTTPAAAKAINAWTSAKTHGKITKLFDHLDSDTLLVLANAIYFKASWQTAFKTKDTRTEPFVRGDASKVTVPFMHADQKVQDHLTDTWQSAQVPYTGGRYTALFVMPTKGTLAQLVGRLTPTMLAQFAATHEDDEGELAIPKFELHTSVDDLMTPLGKLGMGAALRPDSDFSGISPARLEVTQIVQRDYLKVDEQGTEAAAVTGISMAASGTAGPTLYLRPFDHPFLFLIRDTNTGAIVFTAQVGDPSQTS